MHSLRQDISLFGLMFLPGFSWATWVTRTPAMRDTLQASTELMGMILFGFACGSMLGILIAGKLCNALGVRRVMTGGFTLLSIGLLLLAGGLWLHHTWGVFAGLMVYGIGMGLTDIAINIEGAAFESESDRPIMTTLHGFFSLGTLMGALSGMLMTWLMISPVLHFMVAVLILVVSATGLMKGRDWVSDRHAEASGRNEDYQAQLRQELRDKRLLLLGVIILAMALAEGSANDWLPLLMIDGHQFSQAMSTLIYVGFTAGMTAGRFSGSFFISRFGRSHVLRFSALSAMVGLLLVIFSHSSILAAAAVIFWGIGASLGFPLTISAAGEGKSGAIRVTIAATLGYIAFLVGPPALGFIGEIWGLRSAMLPVLLMVTIALFCTGAAAKKEC